MFGGPGARSQAEWKHGQQGKSKNQLLGGESIPDFRAIRPLPRKPGEFRPLERNRPGARIY